VGKPRVAELETQLIISRELNFLQNQTADGMLIELDGISKMIIGLKKSLG